VSEADQSIDRNSSSDRNGSVAPVRHADKLTLTPGGAHSSIEIVNVNNWE